MSTGKALHVAIVVSRYHDFVTSKLESCARAALAEAGIGEDGVTAISVPGAFEIPQAADRAARTLRFDAVICLGCLIRGETPHFEIIAAAVAQGITDAAIRTGVPMSFGVLTTNSAEEALARAADGPGNKGWEAAAAVLEMVALATRLPAGRTSDR